MLNSPLKLRCVRSSNRMYRLLGAWIVACSAMCLPVAAQQTADTSPRSFDRGVVQSPILTIDSERVFLESAFGQRVVREIEAQGEALTSENRQIEADLETEERDLTDMRATLAPEEFRVLANDFDEKVQQIRRAQAEKGRALSALLDKEREVFEQAARPVLERLMRDAGAAVILESGSAVASVSAIEITDDAIARLNETLGSGAAPGD